MITDGLGKTSKTAQKFNTNDNIIVVRMLKTQ